MNMNQTPHDKPCCPACQHPLLGATSANCPECGLPLSPGGESSGKARFVSMPAMRYPSAYLWLVLMATLDIILTWIVIFAHRGWEANPIAASVIDDMGFGGAIVFKYATVLLAIVICEVVGRHNDRSGRQLSWLMVAIGAFPVAYTFAMLFPTTVPPITEIPAEPSTAIFP